MKKMYLLLLLFSFLFPFSAFAEENLPYIIEEDENGKRFAIRGEGYEEYLKEYKASQTTETPVVLPSGENITISTKGVFRIHNAAVLSPEYIKIKEAKAGSLKKGDCIYLELNKGTFLKDISAITTQGDCKAKAVGMGSYIKLEITQTSTVPSEITLNHIMILSGGKNNNTAEKSEFVLSLSSKYMNGDNLFHNNKSVVLNPRFATMEWYDGEYCYASYRFEGRLLFANDIPYCILNDNMLPLYHNTYMKQNYLMVPLRSLYHAFIVDNYFCEAYVINPSISIYALDWDWDTEQNTVTIGNDNYYTVSFQNNSNIVIIRCPHRSDLKDTTIELPVSAEMKDDTLYVPICPETANAILEWDIGKYMYWNDTAKTMLIEH